MNQRFDDRPGTIEALNIDAALLPAIGGGSRLKPLAVEHIPLHFAPATISFPLCISVCRSGEDGQISISTSVAGMLEQSSCLPSGGLACVLRYATTSPEEIL